MQNKIKLILILLCIAVSIQLNAANSGYIITLKGDTIQGSIKKSGSGTPKVCKFKSADSDQYDNYLPGSILSFKTGDRYFISERIFYDDEFQNVFLEVLLKAKLSLYRFPKDRNQEFYVETSDGNIIGLYNEQKKIVLKNNLNPNNFISTTDEYYANYRIYRDILFYVFQNCTSVCQQINTLEYDQESLINLLKEYLSITEKGKEGNTITFEKP
ncbi:MAG: hypothetical protein ACERKD_19120 [Prolixibacteraceae bacterium]